MAGRKPKSDSLRFTELTEKIEKLEGAIAAQTKRLQGYKEERAKLLSHLIVEEMEERRLNYPQVESLLNRLFRGEATKKQLELVSRRNEESPAPVEDESEMVQLIVRVTAKEKKKIYENMAKAQYGNFNSYAKKMMLDGYLIVWASPETRELKRELGNVNRNLNQLVRRANLTGSIYHGDFLDMLECWKKIEKETVHYINQMIRKSG